MNDVIEKSKKAVETGDVSTGNNLPVDAFQSRVGSELEKSKTSLFDEFGWAGMFRNAEEFHEKTKAAALKQREM